MGMLDDVIGSAVPQGGLAKPLMIALFALLASGALTKGSGSGASTPGKAATSPDDEGGGLLGGLGGLLNRFQQNGHDDVIKSWIGTGENKPIAPRQLGSALGSDVVKSLAQRSGLSEEELMAQLSQILPGVVDKLTPNGRIPT